MKSGVQDQHDQHGKTVSTKNTKISWVWWCAPQQEVEAEELVEPGRRKLQ